MKLTIEFGTTEQPVLSVAMVWHPETKVLELLGIYLIKYFVTINIQFK